MIDHGSIALGVAGLVATILGVIKMVLNRRSVRKEGETDALLEAAMDKIVQLEAENARLIAAPLSDDEFDELLDELGPPA